MDALVLDLTIDSLTLDLSMDTLSMDLMLSEKVTVVQHSVVDVVLSEDVPANTLISSSFAVADSSGSREEASVVAFSGPSDLGAGEATIIVAGIVSYSGWSFVPGVSVFLGPSGSATQEVPTKASAVFNTQVGVAVGEHSVSLGFRDPVRL